MGRRYREGTTMKKKILIRFDDVCPTMDFEQWNRAMDLMDRFDIKPLIGIVPECRDEKLMKCSYNHEFWNYIIKLQEKGFKIAMHGLYHVYDNQSPGLVTNRKDTEFAGHSLETQIEKIRHGKEILENKGLYTDVFFAPAHSYDKNTLKALKKNGFTYMSDGKSSKMVKRCGILCIPCREKRVPIKISRNYLTTAVVHVNEWKDDSFDEQYTALKNLCMEHRENIVDFDSFIIGSQGNFFVQYIDETIYLLLEQHIKPLVKKMLKKV